MASEHTSHEPEAMSPATALTPQLPIVAAFLLAVVVLTSPPLYYSALI